MSITFETTAQAVVASVQGRMDSASSPTIETQLVGRIGDGGFVLDLTSLEYISSAGLRVVLTMAKRLKQGNKTFILAGLRPQIREIFEISGFMRILDIADTRADALARL